MLEGIEQVVQQCRSELLSLSLPLHEQAVRHCWFETLSAKLHQLALGFFWPHLRDDLLVWQEVQFLHA